MSSKPRKRNSQTDVSDIAMLATSSSGASSREASSSSTSSKRGAKLDLNTPTKTSGTHRKASSKASSPATDVVDNANKQDGKLHS